MTGNPVIIECHPGHDDALAAADARLSLPGVTTVAGNQTLGKTAVRELGR